MAGTGASATDDFSGVGEEPVFAFGRERRMHARAYEYWVSLLHGRRMPRIGELDPGQLSGFAERSVLVDLPADGGAPVIAYLGGALRDEAEVAIARPTIDDVPPGTLLAELLRRFSDIVAHQAPVGFEAEFAGRAGGRVLHRGILLPFADEDGALASVFGVLSWKQVAAVAPQPDVAAALESVLSSRPRTPVVSAWGDGPGAALATEALPPQSLAQRLAAARTWAALATTDRTRGHASLNAALGAAYDYLLAARDTGITPRKAVRLIFGAALGRLDRVRFAATLQHAARLGFGPGQVAAWLDNHQGGHVAVAIAERKARRAARQAAGAGQAWAETQDALGRIELAVDADLMRLIGRRARAGIAARAPAPADTQVTGAAPAHARRAG